MASLFFFFDEARLSIGSSLLRGSPRQSSSFLFSKRLTAAPSTRRVSSFFLHFFHNAFAMIRPPLRGDRRFSGYHPHRVFLGLFSSPRRPPRRARASGFAGALLERWATIVFTARRVRGSFAPTRCWFSCVLFSLARCGAGAKPPYLFFFFCFFYGRMFASLMPLL